MQAPSIAGLCLPVATPRRGPALRPLRLCVLQMGAGALLCGARTAGLLTGLGGLSLDAAPRDHASSDSGP